MWLAGAVTIASGWDYAVKFWEAVRHAGRTTGP